MRFYILYTIERALTLLKRPDRPAREALDREPLETGSRSGQLARPFSSR